MREGRPWIVGYDVLLFGRFDCAQAEQRSESDLVSFVESMRFVLFALLENLFA